MLRIVIITVLFLAAVIATTAAISVAPAPGTMSQKAKAIGGETAAVRLAQTL